MATEIFPSETFEVSYIPRSGRDGRPIGDPISLNFERGCLVDGSHDSPEGGIMRFHAWTSDLLRRLRIPREIIPPMSADEIRADRDWRTELPPADPNEYAYRSFEDHISAADECERAVSDLLPAGWVLRLDDACYFFEWADDRVGFRFERDDHATFFYLNTPSSDAEISCEHAAHLWRIEVVRFDDDGDESETVGTFAATFAGGRAPYINLWASYGDMSDIFGDAGRTNGLSFVGDFVSHETEVIGLGDDRSLPALEASLASWLRSYADCVDGSDWDHDASHYGFPS